MVSYKNRKKNLSQLKIIHKIKPLNGLLYASYVKKFKFNYFIHGSDWKKGPQSSERKKLINVMKKWKGKVIEPKYTMGISSSLLRKKLSNF